MTKKRIPPLYFDATGADIVARALAVCDSQMRTYGVFVGSPRAVSDYLRLGLAAAEHEVFGVLWLTSANQLIADDRIFRGTLTQTSVYPREIVKAALAHNAAACVLYHNHPSGTPEPSRADELLTRTLRDALALVDVRVMDHMICAGARTVSFAERGLL